MQPLLRARLDRYFLPLSLALLAGLLIYNGNLVWRGYSQPPSPPAASQSHWQAPGEGVFSYGTLNEEGRTVSYSYFFYVDDQLWAADSAEVPAGKAFGFGINLSSGQQMRFLLLRDGVMVEDITRLLGRVQ